MKEISAEGFKSPIILEYEGLQYHSSINDVKPLLRPLSDLRKEIEINGERFIPINKLPIIGMEVLELENDINNGCIEQKYYSKLLEWHFDVFGLIDRGLAEKCND